MLRNDMSSRTIYLYESGMTRYPVLIIDPKREVVPQDRVDVRSPRGDQYPIAYRKGGTRAPGMLAIRVLGNKPEAEHIKLLSSLVDFNLDQLLDMPAGVGQRLLPEDTIAVVVYPKNISSTWDQHHRNSADRQRAREASQAEANSPEGRSRRDTDRAEAEARHRRLIGSLLDEMARRGVPVEERLPDIDDVSWAHDRDEVEVTLLGSQLAKLLGIDWPPPA